MLKFTLIFKAKFKLILGLLIFGLTSSPLFARDWIHPGTFNTQEDYDLIKSRIDNGEDPWKGELRDMNYSIYSEWDSEGLDSLDSKSDDANSSKTDAIAAYANAVMWKLIGKDKYADYGIALLNNWAKLQAFTGGDDQDKLQAGWIGGTFGAAADILSTYEAWTESEQDSVKAMFKRAFYPQLEVMSTWNGNVDLTQIEAMFAISIFNEDSTLFNLAVERWKTRSKAYFYLTSDGDLPPKIAGSGSSVKAFWSLPVKWVDGLSQETCRDNGHHAQFALAAAIGGAEMAYNQGVDLYSLEQERYVAAIELLAKQLLTNDMEGVCKNADVTYTRLNTFEIAYNHYSGRMGLDLPNTAALILKDVRTDSDRANWNVVYETLTHGGLDGEPISPIIQSQKGIHLNIELTQTGRLNIDGVNSNEAQITVFDLSGNVLQSHKGSIDSFNLSSNDFSITHVETMEAKFAFTSLHSNGVYHLGQVLNQ